MPRFLDCSSAASPVAPSRSSSCLLRGRTQNLKPSLRAAFAQRKPLSSRATGLASRNAASHDLDIAARLFLGHNFHEAEVIGILWGTTPSPTAVLDPPGRSTDRPYCPDPRWMKASTIGASLHRSPSQVDAKTGLQPNPASDVGDGRQVGGKTGVANGQLDPPYRWTVHKDKHCLRRHRCFLPLSVVVRIDPIIHPTGLDRLLKRGAVGDTVPQFFEDCGQHVSLDPEDHPPAIGWGHLPDFGRVVDGTGGPSEGHPRRVAQRLDRRPHHEARHDDGATRYLQGVEAIGGSSGCCLTASLSRASTCSVSRGQLCVAWVTISMGAYGGQRPDGLPKACLGVRWGRLVAAATFSPGLRENTAKGKPPQKSQRSDQRRSSGQPDGVARGRALTHSPDLRVTIETDHFTDRILERISRGQTT